MDVGVYPYPHGDQLLIDKIVTEFLSQGKFDKLRKECMSDADTKPAYQNLQQRVESTVTQFLSKQVWRPDLNKNQLRDSLRKHILESGFFDAGINRIVDQVVNPNVLATVFMPEVEEVVFNYLSIPIPGDKNQKKGPVSNGDEKVQTGGNENDCKTLQPNERQENNMRERKMSTSSQVTDQYDENQKPKDLFDKVLSSESDSFIGNIKSEVPSEEKLYKTDSTSKVDGKIKSEPDDESRDGIGPVAIHARSDKMEMSSDESQQSFNRMGVEGLQIAEPDGAPVPDSDDSIPLEINEKTMSDSRDSEDSIMNQMSPISQGRLTPDILEEEETEKGKEVKPDKEAEIKTEEKTEEKHPRTFIGRIPKIKREDPDSSKPSKPETPKKEKLQVLKNIYSSEDTDSSKSFGKSDSDEKREKEKEKEGGTPQKEEKKHKEDSTKKKKHEDQSKKSKDRSHDRSKSEKDRKPEKSRERHESKKSSSSSSRERSSSRHSSHRSRHKDSKSRDRDKKKKEEEKKKSKTTDDHGKERNKREDRRSTDRDSNEREKDRSSGSRSQGESRKREKDQKTGESRKEKTQKEESQVEDEVEIVPEMGDVIIELDEAWVDEDGIVLVDDWIPVEAETEETIQEQGLDYDELHKSGALTKIVFPKLMDDFYVKFNSTGFKYFEDWEQAKLDCEEEFKDFVDEAESNLNLLSDDDSDSGGEFGFEEENKKTIANLLKGVGNFRKSVMFDPAASEFYRWTNNKFYQKFRKKGNGRGRKAARKNESVESIKENIDREESGRRSSDGEKENLERQNKALHLKLLNKYRRQAMRQGRHRKRQRRGKDFLGGIKEKNENRSSSVPSLVAKYSQEFIFNPSILPDSPVKIGNKNLLDGGIPEVEEPQQSKMVEVLPESPDDHSSSDWTISEKGKEHLLTKPPSLESKDNLNLTSLPQKCNLPINLPLSPDSDDVNSNHDLPTKNLPGNKNKRISKAELGGGTPKKQCRRNYSQKYDNQDLYKPRPVLNTSRTRGRDKARNLQLLP